MKVQRYGWYTSANDNSAVEHGAEDVQLVAIEVQLLFVLSAIHQTYLGIYETRTTNVRLHPRDICITVQILVKSKLQI